MPLEQHLVLLDHLSVVFQWERTLGGLRECLPGRLPVRFAFQGLVGIHRCLRIICPVGRQGSDLAFLGPAPPAGSGDFLARPADSDDTVPQRLPTTQLEITRSQTSHPVGHISRLLDPARVAFRQIGSHQGIQNGFLWEKLPVQSEPSAAVPVLGSIRMRGTT